MSYFVTVTFDIVDAKNSLHGNGVYRKITAALDKLDYNKYVTGKKKKKQRQKKLPANTYVAKFFDDGDHQTIFVAYVEKELKKIFKKFKVNGRYFISVGKNWSYKTGAF